MFKKNPNRPQIIVDLKKVHGGYQVQNNQRYSLFQLRKITRTMYRPDLAQNNNLNMQAGGASTIIQPPSHLTLPAFASWYQPDEINQIQKEYFPQFFQEGVDQLTFSFTVRNGRLYKYYRNAIIQLWRQNVKKYLSSAHCRRCLPGDASILTRLHGFLQNWGLINLPSKDHNKGQVLRHSQPLSCYICEDSKSQKYFIAPVQDVIFQVCQNCYKNDLYPQSIKRHQFTQILSKNHILPNSKLMNKSQLSRLLQILQGGGQSRQKDRDLWLQTQKQFSSFTKQQIVYNFLRIPQLVDMNANIFDNNQDLSVEEHVPLTPPTIFEDINNPLQASIAVSYKLWKTQPQKYPILDKIFLAAEKNSKILANLQQQKIIQLWKMLVQMSFSRLQLKSLYIQQYQRLLRHKRQSQKTVFSNHFAQSLKVNLKYIQQQENINRIQSLQ